jgi:hypothetical protein
MDIFHTLQSEIPIICFQINLWFHYHFNLSQPLAYFSKQSTETWDGKQIIFYIPGSLYRSVPDGNMFLNNHKMQKDLLFLFLILC